MRFVIFTTAFLMIMTGVWISCDYGDRLLEAELAEQQILREAINEATFGAAEDMCEAVTEFTEDRLRQVADRFIEYYNVCSGNLVYEYTGLPDQVVLLALIDGGEMYVITDAFEEGEYGCRFNKYYLSEARKSDDVGRVINDYVSRYCELKNSINKKNIQMPLADNRMGGRALDELTLVAVGIRKTFNRMGAEYAVEIADTGIKVRRYYYVDREKKYHRNECAEISEPIAKCNTRREAAELGAYPCSSCFPELFIY